MLQQHFRNLEALALDMMESEQVVDLTRKECAFCCWLLVLGIESGAYTLQGGRQPSALFGELTSLGEIFL